MDYSVFDALRAGFDRVVFVIRPEMREAFDRVIVERYRDRLDVAVATQRLEDLPGSVALPPGRSRPWGTAQAVLAVQGQVSGPFAVLNADDFYGRDALAVIAGFLHHPPEDTFAVVGYRLDQTASPAGGVNRAALEQTADGSLTGIVEVRDLIQASEGRFRGEVDGEPRILPADTLVSMNLWGLTPGIFPRLAEGFASFLAHGPGRTGEYYLPEAVREMLDEGSVKVMVLRTSSRWCGMTYPADRPRVEATLRELVASGEYPEQL